MDLSERFDAAYAAAARSGAPELVGVQLSAACVAVLPVAGAGISVFPGVDFRAPIGASHAAATAAERLQFTTGQGPCLAAHAAGRPVLASEEQLAAHWPAFHRQLIAHTPYRAVAALPLLDGMGGLGAVDLYFCHPQQLAALPLPDALRIAELIAHALSRQAWQRMMAGEAEPDWLGSPAAHDRAGVSIAMGMLTVAADLTFPDALAVLRAHAYATGRTVDDIARELVGRTLSISDLDITGNT